MLSLIAGVINYISATVAVSVFPRSTFVRRESKILRGASDSSEWVQKYKNRGFRIFLDNEDGCDPRELSESRTTFDSQCWKVFFTGKLVFSSSYLYDDDI